MMSAYHGAPMLFDAHPTVDRAPHLPMLGFVLGTAMSVLLWTLIGSFAWALFN